MNSNTPILGDQYFLLKRMIPDAARTFAKQRAYIVEQIDLKTSKVEYRGMVNALTEGSFSFAAKNSCISNGNSKKIATVSDTRMYVTKQSALPF